MGGAEMAGVPPVARGGALVPGRRPPACLRRERRPRLRPTPRSMSSIIGAGMSGILAAIRLKQAGVPFVILEKNHDVGGTWLENTYPGARVDVSNVFYSYSFAQSGLAEALFDPGRAADYSSAARRSSASASTSASPPRWCRRRVRTDHAWPVRVRTRRSRGDDRGGGGHQRGRPAQPAEVPGDRRADPFAGPSFHSARWDHASTCREARRRDRDGRSAAQFIPYRARSAS